MKNIIIGQLLLWFNIATIIIGWKIVQYLSLPETVAGLMFFIGIIGSCANLFFSIAIQVRAYIKLGLISSDI